MDASGSSPTKRTLQIPLLHDQKLPYVVPPSAPLYDGHHHHYHYPPVPEPDGEPILATVLTPNNSSSSSSTTDRTHWTAVTDPRVQAEITRPLSLDPRPQDIPSSFGVSSSCSGGPPSSSAVAHALMHGAHILAARRSVEEDLQVSEADRQGWQNNVLDHASLRAAEAAAARRRGQGGGRGGGMDEEGLQVDPSMHDDAPSLSELLASRQKKKEEGGRDGGRDGVQEQQKQGEYQVAEYKIGEGYQISEYRSIYDP